MDNFNSTFRTFRAGLPLALVFTTTLLLSASAHAHKVIGVNGKPTHQHVYKKAANGKGVIMGHAAKPPGSNGIVIWQSAPAQSYSRAQSGMSIPRNPWSSKTRKPGNKSNQKQLYKRKPAFTKQQSRTSDLNPD